MGTRHRVASVADLAEHRSRVVKEVEGMQIAVFNKDGEFHAILNYCPHQSGPLGEGNCTGYMEAGDDGWEWIYSDEDQYVACPWHNWLFDIETGRSPQHEGYGVPKFDVIVEDENIYVEV